MCAPKCCTLSYLVCGCAPLQGLDTQRVLGRVVQDLSNVQDLQDRAE